MIKLAPKAKPEPIAGRLLYLKPEQLRTHPKNLRRFYPVDQVREMADSIKAAKGVLQPLIVVPGAESKYLVVDGNMRLAGARLLGQDCPPLKCEQVSMQTAEQLLAMAITAKFRYDPDPVSEALHYRRLQQEGFSVQQISERTGIYTARIFTRLKLLDLDEAIQQLVAESKLPHDQRVVEALMSIPLPEARIKLARRFASSKCKIATIQNACERLNEQLRQAAQAEEPAPAVRAVRRPAKANPVPWPEVRTAVKAMCEQCDIRLSDLQMNAEEPAWELISHAAGQTCNACNLKKVTRACELCPSVELLKRLAKMAAKPGAKNA